MLRTVRLLAVLTPAVIWSAVAVAGDPGPEGQFVSDPGGDKIIAEAIERGIKPMNFIARPIARSRLKKTNPPTRSLVISRTANEVVISFDGARPTRSPSDGTVVKWTRDDGEVFDLSTRWHDTGLVQTFKAPDGSRTNTFALSPDGASVNLQVRLESPRLPGPVEYTLIFRRSP